jgi:hypothetical protein
MGAMGYILDTIKEYFSKERLRIMFSKDFRFQQVGFALILAALVLTWQTQVAVALIVLTAVGILDIILCVKKKMTISQWVHNLLPKFADIVIMIGILAYSWFIFGPVGFLPICIGVIMGHLFWQEGE